MAKKIFSSCRLDRAHGSPYDCGSKDSYYRRGRNPHYYQHIYPDPKDRVPITHNLSYEQHKEYNKGYDDNEKLGDFKDYGDFNDE